MPIKKEKSMIALRAIFFRVSCSGSALHFRNVATSLAIWLAVAGVPSEYSITWKQKTAKCQGEAAMVFKHLDSYLVVQCLGHANSTSREVRVIIKAVTEGDASRRVAIARQKREDVVLATMARRGNVREVGWQCAVVGCTGSFVVGIGSRETVWQLARSLEHVTLFIRAVRDLRESRSTGFDVVICNAMCVPWFLRLPL